ncbi:MAG: TetR/AcrR family transcriptional regulator [Bacteroidota bacterium]|nr:TetR/AcrR family transcriptional regulator [Bacteroidota bacterium]
MAADTLTPRQREIVDAAIRLISEHSIQELTIKKLSARIGVTEAALYRHFPSKLDILAAILGMFRQNAVEVHTRLRDMPDDPLQQIEFLFMSHFRTFAAKPYLADVVFSEEIFQNDSRLADTVYSIMNLNLEILQSLLEKGRLHGQVREDMRVQELTIIIVGSLRMLVTRWRLERFRSDLELQGRAMWETLRRIITRE